MEAALLSNININSLSRRLGKAAENYSPDGYNTWVRELLDDGSNFYTVRPGNCFVIIDGAELIPDAAQFQSDIDDAFAAIERGVSILSTCNFFIFDMDFRRTDIDAIKNYDNHSRIECYWFEKITALAEKHTNVYPFGFKALVEKLGRNSFYSEKIWYLSSCPFSAKAEDLIIRHMLDVLDAQKQAAKKCLVLDLDNTLWPGVAAEDFLPLGKIELTGAAARFRDFQKKLLQIKNLGVLLCIASKNNEDDILPLLSGPEMVLKEQDFVIKKINWKPKSQSISEIAAQLNIGLDAIVFVDDNPVEREAVRINLPAVCVPEFPQDTAALAEFGDKLYQNYFLRLSVLDEDREKTKVYQQNAARETFHREFASLDDFLNGLDMRLTVWRAKPADVPRMHQMLLKTNQFNLTGKKYSAEALASMINDDNYLCLLASASDKFGDSGTAILLTGRYQGGTLDIEAFLMSCRIMGRSLEYGFWLAAEDAAKQNGAKKITAAYIPTGRNTAIKNLLPNLNYSLCSEGDNGEQLFSLDLTAPRSAPECFAVVSVV